MSSTYNPHIPIANKLIYPGDPARKARAAKRHTTPSHLDELNARIDELESAIGQDANGPVGRAFAIRAENNNKHHDTQTNPKHPEKDQEIA